MHIRYRYHVSISNGFWYMEICLSYCILWENLTLAHKIQKWEHSDLNLSMPCGTPIRCVWYGTSRPGSLKSRCLFQWKLINWHWRCLLLQWPWQRSNWSGWCMWCRPSIDLFAFMKEIFQTPIWQWVPTPNVKNVNNSYDPGELENKVKIKCLTWNKSSCHYAY